MLIKKLIVLPCLILSCASLTGCLGLVVAHPQQKYSEQFSLGKRGEVCHEGAVTNLTKVAMLDLWGQPNSKRNGKDGVVVWRYKGKFTVCGVIPMFIIAIPIPFPAGHEYVEIYFKDGIAQKVSQTVGVISGAAIGPTIKGSGRDSYILAWEKEEDQNR